jgi:hypothetical protein
MFGHEGRGHLHRSHMSSTIKLLYAFVCVFADVLTCFAWHYLAGLVLRSTQSDLRPSPCPTLISRYRALGTTLDSLQSDAVTKNVWRWGGDERGGCTGAAGQLRTNVENKRPTCAQMRATQV